MKEFIQAFDEFVNSIAASGGVVDNEDNKAKYETLRAERLKLYPDQDLRFIIATDLYFGNVLPGQEGLDLMMEARYQLEPPIDLENLINLLSKGRNHGEEKADARASA
jgi:hypothetical protein